MNPHDAVERKRPLSFSGEHGVDIFFAEGEINAILTEDCIKTIVSSTRIK